MNFKISKKEFLDALTISTKAVSSNTPLPILGGVKLSCNDKSLTLLSSDSNISIKTIINNENKVLEVEEGGELVLDAKYLLEIIRKIDFESILFETIDGNLIRISGGTSEYKINGINANDYPNISFDVPSNKFNIESELFVNSVNQTIFACSDKETRPVLTGVNLKTSDNKLIINATDSYRLAYKTIDLDTKSEFNITIPNKYLTEVIRSINNEKEIEIAIDSQQIFFIFGNTIIKTRLLDDAFPETNKLIPSNFTQTLKLDSREAMKQLDKTSFIRGDGKSVIKMKINSEFVEITSQDSIGSFYGKMSVISFEGEPFEIACSGTYLQEAIKSINTDVITICFSGQLKPLIIKDSNDEKLIQLISPVRTYN